MSDRSAWNALWEDGSYYTGASTTKRSLRGFGLRSIDADSEVLRSLPKLRDRSRELYRNNTIGRGAVSTTVTNVIGTGLSLQSRVDRKVLGISEDEAGEWEANTEMQFNMWAESLYCDASMSSDLNELMELAFRTTLVGGEVLTTMPIIPGRGFNPLAIQLIEGDRLSNPPEHPFDDDKISGGIENGPYGEPKAYYIQATHPNAPQPKREWKRILAYGGQSKRLQVIHLFRKDRPGQKRGLPMLTPVIDAIKTLGQYTDAEVQKALIQALYTVFIKTESGELDGTAYDKRESELDKGEDETKIELGAGTVVGLAENESIETAGSTSPNPNYDPFFSSIMKQVGMALEIPLEVLQKHFQSSYSAARGALLDAWRTFKARRVWFSRRWCRPIYEEWLFWAIALGQVNAPGYFDSEILRRAWSGAQWVGPSPGHLDPQREANYWGTMVDRRWASNSEASSALQGNDFDSTIQRIAREEDSMRKLNLTFKNATVSESNNAKI